MLTCQNYSNLFSSFLIQMTTIKAQVVKRNSHEQAPFPQAGVKINSL